MTGGGLPQDEQDKKLPEDGQDKKEFPNLRLEALKDIQSYAEQKLTFIRGYNNMLKDIMSHNSGVDAPDTWVCRAANDEGSELRNAAGKVASACNQVFEVIDSEIGNIHASGLDKVPEGHPDATWKL